MKKLLLVPLFLLFLLFPFQVSAVTFDNIVSLGDSLSDDGSGNGRFTDGLIWTENLANLMGANLYNVAHGGSTTGYGDPGIPPILSVPTLSDQVLMPLPNNPSTLFTVWSGANNLLRPLGVGLAPGNPVIAAQEVFSAINGLTVNYAATDILLLNLPDIGLTPRFYTGPYQALASGWVSAYNDMIDALLIAYDGTANIHFVDIFSLFNDMMELTDPVTIGITQAMHMDLFMTFPPDGIHPRSYGHELIADEAWRILTLGDVTPVPEPATMFLFGIGILGITRVSRRKKTITN